MFHRVIMAPRTRASEMTLQAEKPVFERLVQELDKNLATRQTARVLRNEIRNQRGIVRVTLPVAQAHQVLEAAGISY